MFSTNAAAGTPSRTTRFLVALGLFLGTVLLFGRTLGNDFIDFDDPGYVTKNPHVEAGLTREGFWWAWTSYYMSNWHPLTWLSLQLDAQTHGPRPWGFHLTNVLLHAFSAVVLLLALWRMTGALWRSALVAALFAWHPLHVESVAWVAERKDVLSGLFWMLCLWAYACYAERPSLRRYAGVLLLYALGLTAKPMLVTLPCVLLLLDYWPLGRFGGLKPARLHALDRNGARTANSFKLAIVDKIPMLALSVLSSVLTWQAQSSGKAVMNLEHLQLSTRAANAVASYFVYLEKAFWPSDLTVFYALNRELRTAWALAGAGCALAAVTAVAILTRRRAPYVLVGWLWYVGTLVPVIGLVQVGSQARADRYTYIPLIGIFLIASWGLADLARYWQRRLPAVALAAAALAGCVVLSWVQIGFWQDSTHLWQHALQVDPENPLAHINLAAEMGKKLAGKDRLDPEDMPLVRELEAHYHAVLKVLPTNCKAHYDLGVLCLQQEKYPEALRHLREALPGSPEDPQINNNLGRALIKLGRPDDAEPYLRQAIKSDDRYFRAHYNLGEVLEAKGRLDEAAAHYQRALELRPDYESAAQGLERIAWKRAHPGAADHH